MGLLVDLPGVARPDMRGEFFGSVTSGIKRLSVESGLISAGDHGCVTLYIDDNGLYRGIFERWMATESSIECATKKELKPWLKEWLPKTQRP